MLIGYLDKFINLATEKCSKYIFHNYLKVIIPNRFGLYYRKSFDWYRKSDDIESVYIRVISLIFLNTIKKLN